MISSLERILLLDVVEDGGKGIVVRELPSPKEFRKVGGEEFLAGSHHTFPSHHAFGLGPGTFDTLGMSTSTGINKIDRMVHSLVTHTHGGNLAVGLPLI